MTSLDEALELRPELAARFARLRCDVRDGLGEEIFDVVESRIRFLHGLEGAALAEPSGMLAKLSVEFAELFVIDVHAITDELTERIVECGGERWLIALGGACAVLDCESKMRQTIGVQ